LSGPSITLTLASTPGGSANVASGIPNSLALPSNPVRANEGKGDITIVASAFNFTSTTVGLPHFEQLNCTFAWRVTSSSFKTCSAPQFVHFTFIAVSVYSFSEQLGSFVGRSRSCSGFLCYD